MDHYNNSVLSLVAHLAYSVGLAIITCSVNLTGLCSINEYFSSPFFFSVKQTRGDPLLFKRPGFLAASTVEPSMQVLRDICSPAER